MKKPRLNTVYSKSESGSAIIAVLMSLAVLSIAAMLYFTGTVSNMKSQKLVESKEHFQSLESAVVNEIAASLKELKKNECFSKDLIANRPFGFEDVTSTLQFTKLPIEDKKLKVESLSSAIKRCSKPTFIAKADIANAKRSHLYFCLRFDNGAEAGSAVSSRSFVEVAIDFESTSTDKRISCRQFMEDPGAIAKISYGLYLNDGNATPPASTEFSRKFGSAIAKSGATP